MSKGKIAWIVTTEYDDGDSSTEVIFVEPHTYSYYKKVTKIVYFEVEE